jgi:uncharacterized protein with PIN domain
MHPDQGLEQVRKDDLAAAVEEATAAIAGEMEDWYQQHPQATLTEIEQQVLRARKKFGEQLMQTVLAKRGSEREIPGPRCPECGAEMHYKGEKERRVVSSVGETTVKRGYYYCSKCKRSIFPPG